MHESYVDRYVLILYDRCDFVVMFLFVYRRFYLQLACYAASIVKSCCCFGFLSGYT